MKLLIAMCFSLSRRATGRRALGFVLMLLCLLPARSAHAQSDRHMLWTISSEDGPEGSLVGSVHLMKPDVYPLGKAYDRAFAAADVVAFEPALAAAPPAGAQEAKALVGGTLIRPAQGDTLAGATVVIEGTRIVAVGPPGEVEVPEGAERIDARGQYVMPGLIDAHVHFFQSGGLYTRPDGLDLRFRKSYKAELADIKARLSETLERYLKSGITSVVDVGGPRWNLDVRQHARQQAKAPRVRVAGPLISSVARPKLDLGDPPILKVETPEEARRIVQEQAEAGFDLIKLWYIVRPEETPAAFRPVAEAAIEEAHAAGKRVAVHATELETARAAVEAGADLLVHSVFDQPVDDAFVQLLKENDVIYTPTIMVRERYGEVFAGAFTPTEAERRLADEEVLASLDDLREKIPADSLPRRVRALLQRGLSASAISPSATAMQNLEALHEAGVTIAAGTDAGNIGTPHGPSLYYELELMRQAGLTPMEVLRAATLGGATLMGQAGELGRLEAGALADLVVLRKNPLDDLSNAATVVRVVEDGRVFSAEDLLSASGTR